MFYCRIPVTGADFGVMCLISYSHRRRLKYEEGEVFGRAGPNEMIAYMLVAVATYNKSRFALTQDMHSLKDIYHISPVPRMSLEQWVGTGLAIALIILGGWREATIIMAL